MPTFGSKQRPLAALAVFAAGAVAGLFFSPSPAITADGDSLAVVSDFAAALETRVTALEDLLVTHISAENQGPPRDGGVVLKAPFNIVDDSNQVIFAVEADGGGGIVQVMADGGKRGVRLDGSQNRITTEGDDGTVEIGSTNSGWGLLVRDAGGQPMADLSEPQGKGMALRIYNEGANAAQIGTAPGTGGLLRLFANGDKRTVGLDSNADGSGSIQVTGKEGEDVGGIWLDGQRDVVRVKSDRGVAALGGDDSGWGMVVKDAGGNPEASINNPGAGMALRVYESGTEVLAAGNVSGKGGTVRVFSTSGTSAGASMDVNPDGSGTIQAADSTGSKGVKMDGEKMTLLIDSDEGKVDLGKTGKGWGLVVSDGGGAPMAELSEPQGKGMALRIYNQGENAAQIGTAPGTGGLLRLFASGDKRTIGLDSNADGTGLIQVAGTKGEDFGIRLDGKNNQIMLDTDKGTVGLGDGAAGWGLVIGDPAGSRLADLAKADGRGVALRVYEGEQQAAALGLIPGEGGQLRIYSKSALAISAGADGNGGRLQVYKAGVPTAVLNGNQSLVAVVNEAGTPISMLMVAASGSGGKVQATDPGGTPVFKGGFIPDGPGLACVDNDGTKCLGIGLTGMEGFH